MSLHAHIDPHQPGAELVARGLADLADGEITVESALLCRARLRLADIGIDLPTEPLIADPDATMYRLVEARVGDQAGHASYNALTRRLVSFMDAAELAARRRPT